MDNINFLVAVSVIGVTLAAFFLYFSKKSKKKHHKLGTQKHTETTRTETHSESTLATSEFKQEEITQSAIEINPEVDEVEEKKDDAFTHLKKGITKARTSFIHALSSILDSDKQVDIKDELETILVSADVGIKSTQEILSKLKVNDNIIDDLKSSLLEIIKRPGLSKFHETIKSPSNKPHVVFFVGINGVGKTTTLGKIANQLTNKGYKVVIGAADTFRAAAIEQLEVWANRSGAEIIKQQQNSDPASVVFDALAAGKARNADFILIDTAGRLHTKQNLMEELKKLDRVAKKVIPEAPHDAFLVIDASTGQNALAQSKIFAEVMPLSGIIMTKLDGTSKGGTLVGITSELNVPVVYAGVGEKIEDLMEFSPEDYVNALLDDEGIE